MEIIYSVILVIGGDAVNGIKASCLSDCNCLGQTTAANRNSGLSGSRTASVVTGADCNFSHVVAVGGLAHRSHNQPPVAALNGSAPFDVNY